MEVKNVLKRLHIFSDASLESSEEAATGAKAGAGLPRLALDYEYYY